VILTTVKLLAPILPYVTDRIYRDLFASLDGAPSIHTSLWPAPDGSLLDEQASETGDALVDVATAVRRYKSDRSLSLSFELERLQLAVDDARLAEELREAIDDIASVTRAKDVTIGAAVDAALEQLPVDGVVTVAVTQRPPR